MSKTEDKLPIGILMFTFLLILLMYVYTYSRDNIWFWGFFILERLMSLSYNEQIDAYMDEVGPDNVKGSTIGIVALITLAIIVIFIYTFFKYPVLFVILMIGECIDSIAKRVKRKLKKSK